MSATPTTFRQTARMGWGGRAASHFRGLIAAPITGLGLPTEAPQMNGVYYLGQIGDKVYRSNSITLNTMVQGVTRDSAGTALGLCRVELYPTGTDCSVREITSDAVGVFTFFSPGSGPFYLVAYKAGSPDIAGTTVNTIQPTVV